MQYDIETVLEHYMICALWSSVWLDKPLDAIAELDDIAPETRRAMRAEIADFLGACEAEGLDLSPITAEQFGHDFWLTRNGHGAGFWDRGLGELGDKLTAMSKPYGESYLYPGDDGRIYVS